MSSYYELQEPEFHVAIRSGTLGEMLSYLDTGVELELWKVSRRKVKRRMMTARGDDGAWAVWDAALKCSCDSVVEFKNRAVYCCHCGKRWGYEAGYVPGVEP